MPLSSKAAARHSLRHIISHPECHGRLGQNLRQIKSYYKARQLFISPSPILAQLRINALLDGKDVIMPGPGLKEGFYLLKPHTVPFPKLPFAVTMKGVSKFGRLLSGADLDRLRLDLLITDAVAVDEQGVRLGDGLGFFDLACAILAAHQPISTSCANYVALDNDKQLVPGLPSDDWDIGMDGIILPGGIKYLPERAGAYSIFWDILPEKRIKKIKPLWDLWRSLNPTSPKM